MINIWKAKGGKNMSIVYNLDVRCHEMLKYLLYQDIHKYFLLILITLCLFLHFN